MNDSQASDPLPRCTVDLLVQAPEMAVLRVLLDAIDAARLALFAVHPTLVDDFCQRSDPPTLRIARTLLRCTVDLRRALVAYAHALDDALRLPHEFDSDDDGLF